MAGTGLDAFSAQQESALHDALERLPAWARAVFAALCAERIVHAPGLNLGNTDRATLKHTLDELWTDLSASDADQRRLAGALDSCMRLMPAHEDDPVNPDTDDAAAAVAYAIRTRITGSSQEAVWAAQRGQEVIFRHVEIELGELPDLPAFAVMRARLEEIQQSAPMQSELRNERDDLARLGQLMESSLAESLAGIHDLRERARMRSPTLLSGS